MSKLVLLLTLLGIALVYSLCLTDPNNSMVWLASDSINFSVLRFGMMVALAALLITDPPRNIVLRSAVGVFALAIAGWSIGATYANHMQIVDTMLLLAFSVSSGLAVLERDIEFEDEVEEVKKTPRATTKRKLATN